MFAVTQEKKKYFKTSWSFGLIYSGLINVLMQLMFWCGQCFGVVDNLAWLIFWCGRYFGVFDVMVWCGRCFGVVDVLVWSMF